MIKINNDKLFRLIQEMKEYRFLLPNESTRDTMKRHKIKTEYLILDKVLKDEGIDKLISKVRHEKKNIEMVKQIIKEEKSASVDNK